MKAKFIFYDFSYNDDNFNEVDNGDDGERDIFTGSSIDSNETMSTTTYNS